MAKKKTRKQKILADKRHVLYHLENSARLAGESARDRQSAQESESLEKKVKVDLPSVLPVFQTQTRSFQTGAPYAHVLADIKKTALITGAIVTAQVILFFVLKVA